MKQSARTMAEPIETAEIVLDVFSNGGCTVAQPITVGVPIPRGLLSRPGAARLLGPTGDELTVQAAALARWPDQSVKWLLADFVAASLPAGRSVFKLLVGQVASEAARTSPLRMVETPGSVVVRTGSAEFEVARSGGVWWRHVRVAGRAVVDPEQSQVVLTDSNGSPCRAIIDDVAIEACGPVRATLRVVGTFGRRVPAGFVARLCFFAGLGLTRIRWTIHNPRRAIHPGGLWDLGDGGSLLFRDLSLTFGMLGVAERLGWVCSPNDAQRIAPPGGLEIYQDSSGGENWNSPNHADRSNRVPCSFRGYRERYRGLPAELGLRASPIVWLANANDTIAAASPFFWQQFPKAIEADEQRLRVRLFPQQFAGAFELQGGEQKTHTVWVHFGPREDKPVERLRWIFDPASVALESDWCAASEALPYFAPAGRTSATLHEPLLDDAIAGPNNLFARREVIDEYGWRNFGDLFADHEAADYNGPAPIVSHFNNQYDVVFGSLLQFLRGGDRRWSQLSEALARHVIDIDIYHTDEDRAAYNGGMFWPTDHFRHAKTCTHRTYSRANYPADRPCGGGPSNEHNYTTGLLHHHFFTGDPLARDAVIGLAEWVIRMDDGRNNLLGLVDRGPTGLASRTRDDDYHGPGRGCGNSVNALVDAWSLTGERRFMDKAESLIRRSVHPSDPIDQHDLLNVESRWSYTVFLAALARYLDIKVEHGELDFMYAYGRASLTHYAQWMLQHETAYLDHPERLEYPNETWAAQELRKANVMRQAACHASPSMRDQLWRRAHELSDRAWTDLGHFAARGVTRVVALVLVEGARDAFWRSHPPHAAPRPVQEHDFGAPQPFVSQRRRVREQLRSPRGILRLLGRLAANLVRAKPKDSPCDP